MTQQVVYRLLKRKQYRLRDCSFVIIIHSFMIWLINIALFNSVQARSCRRFDRFCYRNVELLYVSFCSFFPNEDVVATGCDLMTFWLACPVTQLLFCINILETARVCHCVGTFPIYTINASLLQAPAYKLFTKSRLSFCLRTCLRWSFAWPFIETPFKRRLLFSVSFQLKDERIQQF